MSDDSDGKTAFNRQPNTKSLRESREKCEEINCSPVQRSHMNIHQLHF